MATSGARKRAFASSKFSRRTRETYSGWKAISAGSAPQPRVQLPPLCVGRTRIDFESPALRRVGPEGHGDTLELLAARNQECHFVAGPVLLEPVLEPIGAYAEVINRQDLVVDVEAGDVGWRIALHLRDEETSVVNPRRDSEPRFRGTVRTLCDRLEPQTKCLQRFGVVEFRCAFDGPIPERVQADAGDLLCHRPELLGRVALWPREFLYAARITSSSDFAPLVTLRIRASSRSAMTVPLV